MTVLQLFGPSGPASAPARAASFDLFWQQYPRRVAKQDAARAWARLGPADQAAALAAVEAHAALWREERREPRHVPHAATWINGRRWEDEIDSAQADADEALIRACGG